MRMMYPLDRDGHGLRVRSGLERPAQSIQQVVGPTLLLENQVLLTLERFHPVLHAPEFRVVVPSPAHVTGLMAMAAV
jgi:hypothetical protein